ncbi:hypothetical protein [Shewanella sp.]
MYRVDAALAGFMGRLGAVSIALAVSRFGDAYLQQNSDFVDTSMRRVW